MEPDEASADEPMDVVESGPRVFEDAGAQAAAQDVAAAAGGAGDAEARILYDLGLAERTSDGESDPMDDASLEGAMGGGGDGAGPSGARNEPDVFADMIAASGGGDALATRGGGAGKRSHLGRFEDPGERHHVKLAHAKFYNKFDDDFDELDMKLK